MLVNGRFWTVDTMFYTKELMEGAARYAYFILSKMELASMNAGSAVPSMTTKILSAIQVVLPSEAHLTGLKAWSDPLFEQLRLNEHENEKLSALRDVLPPKLMSGEIDLSNSTPFAPSDVHVKHRRHWSFTLMPCCPTRSCCSFSRWLLGGILKSRKSAAASIIWSFLYTMRRSWEGIPLGGLAPGSSQVASSQKEFDEQAFGTFRSFLTTIAGGGAIELYRRD